MALVRPLPAAAAAAGESLQQLNAALAVAKEVVTRYGAVATQVKLHDLCREHHTQINVIIISSWDLSP
jgi:hypothetical protein